MFLLDKEQGSVCLFAQSAYSHSLVTTMHVTNFEGCHICYKVVSTVQPHDRLVYSASVTIW